MERIKNIIKKIWSSEVMCILFHNIHTKHIIVLVDELTGRPYIKYTCKTCGRKYIANSIRDWYRIKWSKKIKKLKK
jgi:hypothetical protein